jgi:hypothetical protein
MKKVLILAIAMVFSAQVFAESQVQQVYRLSAELATVNTQLALAKSERSSQIKKVVISTTAAVALGLLSRKLIQAKGGDITGPFSLVLGGAASIATIGVIGYDGYQVYRLTISNKAIPALQKSISDKQAELDLVLKADNESQKALKEINN